MFTVAAGSRDGGRDARVARFTVDVEDNAPEAWTRSSLPSTAAPAPVEDVWDRDKRSDTPVSTTTINATAHTIGEEAADDPRPGFRTFTVSGERDLGGFAKRDDFEEARGGSGRPATPRPSS